MNLTMLLTAAGQTAAEEEAKENALLECIGQPAVMALFAVALVLHVLLCVYANLVSRRAGKPAAGDLLPAFGTALNVLVHIALTVSCIFCSVPLQETLMLLLASALFALAINAPEAFRLQHQKEAALKAQKEAEARRAEETGNQPDSRSETEATPASATVNEEKQV